MQHDESRQRQREQIRAECEARNIKIEERGECFVLRGPGVSMLVADLSILDKRDLSPWPSK